MEVVVEHFLNAGEQDSKGYWDYYYEGDSFTFHTDSSSLKARIYTDTPTQASFTEGLSSLEASPLTADAVAFLRDRGATEVRCLGPEGYIVWWSES